MNATASPEGITFSFGSQDQIKYTVSALNLTLAHGHDAVVDAHEAALLSFDKSLQQVERIKGDLNLSDAGKEKQLAQPRAEAAVRIAGAFAATLDHDARLDLSEQRMLAVPAAVGPEATIEDQEIRSWYRSLPLAQRMKLVERMEQSNELQRLSVALLRGPAVMMLSDVELKLVKDTWDRRQREADPKTSLLIAGGRTTAEWARRSLSHLGALATRSLGWDRMRVLRSLVESGNEQAQRGVAVFGLGPQQLELMRLQVASKQFHNVV